MGFSRVENVETVVCCFVFMAHFPASHRIHGTGIIICLHLVDLYGKFVCKYTVRPMDPKG